MVFRSLQFFAWLWLFCHMSSLLCLSVRSTDIFDSLSKMEQYASLVTEYPTPDNDDWENPDFSTYYQKLSAHKLYKTLKLPGGIDRLWDIKGFKSLLEQVTHIREHQGYEGKYVMKISPIPGTRIVIFGEMHGAFHSLVRDLQALKKIGYIDEHLKIREPDCFIAFNGNIASRSSYTLETFTAILSLIYANPDKVIYIRGSQEDKTRWIHYSLKNELKTRASGFSDGQIPLENCVNRFFNTLPLAVYLVAAQKANTIDLVRISSYGTDIRELSEKEFSDFFTHPDISIGSIEEGARKKTTMDINLRAIIRGEQFFKSQYIPSTGLQLSGREEGATGWVVMSSPVQANQILFQFYYDAFALLTTYATLDDWTLTLFNRDVREFAPIKSSKVFKLVSGIELSPKEAVQSDLKSYQQRIAYLETMLTSLDESLQPAKAGQLKTHIGAPEPIKEVAAVETLLAQPKAEVAEQIAASEIPMGTDPTSITVGGLTDLSDGCKEEGNSVVQAIHAVFNKQNEYGGIRGKKLNFEIKDTHYSVEYSRKAVEQLLFKDKTGIILIPFATNAVEGCLELLKKNLLLALFPAASGATGIRNADLRTIFFIRASTVQEGYILTKYAVENSKAKRIAFFYEDDTFGMDSLQGAQKALQELGIKNSMSVSFDPQHLNLAEQVAILKKSNIDALVCFGMQAAVKELFTQLGTAWLVNKKLFGTMDLSILPFRKYCERNGLQFVSTSIVPSPETSELEIVKEYRRAIENNPPGNDIHCLEAFIGADFFVHVLEQIGEPVTSEKIINFLENLKDYQYKGLEFTFNPSTRQLMHNIWLNKGSDEWEKISTIELENTFAQAIQNQMQESALVKERQEEKVTTTKDAKNRKKLTIGASMDLSRGVKDLGIAVKEATELVLKIERVRGLDIRFIPMDDMYSPEKARENILQLKNQYGVDFLLNPVGTPTFFSYLDLIKTGTLAVFFPVPGISYRRTRANAMHNCIYFRPSYEDESFLLMRYIIDKRNPKKIAFFYQNDQFGLACMEGIHKVLANSPIEVIELPYLRNDVNFDTQVETVKKMNTDYIGLLATPLAATQFLEQLGDDFIRRNKFFGVSDLGGATFQNLITKKGIDIVMTNVVPDPKASSITMVQEYRYHAEKAGIPFDTFSLEAYITTMIFVNVLRTIDENITKDAVIEAIQGIKNYNLKGLPLNFDPKTRQLSNKIWISGGESSWKEVQMPTLEELHMTSTFDH